MLVSDFILFIILVAAIFYWLDGIRAKEVATEKAAAACKKILLEFLDQTVAIKKVRLRRDTSGRLKFYREYQFEFSSTGEFRYKGTVQMLGHHMLAIDMEAYQFNEVNE